VGHSIKASLFVFALPDALRLRLGLSNERMGPEREVSTALAPRSFLDVFLPPRLLRVNRLTELGSDRPTMAYQMARRFRGLMLTAIGRRRGRNNVYFKEHNQFSIYVTY
jgi:hypothetical protein